jgi:hypothetical protein
MGKYLNEAIKKEDSEATVKHARNLANILEGHAIVWKP